MALQLALTKKINTADPDVFLISSKGLGEVNNRAVAVLFDMAQDLICKLLSNCCQLLFLVVNQLPVKGFSLAIQQPFGALFDVPFTQGMQAEVLTCRSQAPAVLNRSSDGSKASDVIPLHCLATLPSAIAVLWSLYEVGSHQDQDAVINCLPVQSIKEINSSRVVGPPVLTAQNSGQAVDEDCVVLL